MAGRSAQDEGASGEAVLADRGRLHVFGRCPEFQLRLPADPDRPIQGRIRLLPAGRDLFDVPRGLTVDRPTVVMLIVGTLLLVGAAVAYGRSVLVFPLILFGGL